MGGGGVIRGYKGKGGGWGAREVDGGAAGGGRPDCGIRGEEVWGTGSGRREGVSGEGEFGGKIGGDDRRNIVVVGEHIRVGDRGRKGARGEGRTGI